MCCIADLHGLLPPWDVPECDLLLVAGDSGPDPVRLAARFFDEELTPWLRRQPARHVVAVAGNHDAIALTEPQRLRALPWHYLDNEAIDLDGVRIAGSPWTPHFVEGWSFTATEPLLARFWARIPDDTHMLLVHGPPHGVLDRTNGSPRLHLGSETLRARIDELSALRIVVCGHIHEARGIETLPSGVTVVNASLVDEHYRLVHEPILVELPTPEGKR